MAKPTTFAQAFPGISIKGDNLEKFTGSRNDWVQCYLNTLVDFGANKAQAESFTKRRTNPVRIDLGKNPVEIAIRDLNYFEPDWYDEPSPGKGR